VRSGGSLTTLSTQLCGLLSLDACFTRRRYPPDAREGFSNLNGRGVRQEDHAVVPRLLALERMQS
jgi:hypothetical protein